MSQICVLYEDVEEILSWNAELREGEWADEWRQEWFAIGNSPCGDTYFLDLMGASPAVFLWDHETHEVSEEAADLDQFILDQRAGAEETLRILARQREEQQREEAERMRYAGRIIWRGFLIVIVLPIVIMILWVWYRNR
jgi:hypothetical protein